MTHVELPDTVFGYRQQEGSRSFFVDPVNLMAHGTARHDHKV